MCEESPESGGLYRVKIRKTQVCLWKDVSVGDLERLEGAGNNEDVRRALSAMLNVSSGACDPGASALLDLYYYSLRFCWDCGFSREQTACVLSVVKETHAACVGSPLGNVAECYRHLQELLLCHAVHRPPFSVSVFSPQQLQRVQEYIVETYFRHFKLYKYVFTPQVHLDLSLKYNGVSKTSDEGADVHRGLPGTEASPSIGPAGDKETSGADGGGQSSGEMLSSGWELPPEEEAAGKAET